MDNKLKKKLLTIFGEDFFDIVSEDELKSVIKSFEDNSEQNFEDFISDFSQIEDDFLNDGVSAYGYGGTATHNTGTINQSCF